MAKDRDEARSLLPAVLAKAGLAIRDSDDAAEQIAARYANADDVAELLDISESLSTEEVIGLPFLLRDVQLMESQLEDSAGVYLLLDAVFIDTGEVAVITTGAGEVMVKAARLKQLGALPQKVKIIEKRAATAGRNAPLSLVAADWKPRKGLKAA